MIYYYMATMNDIGKGLCTLEQLAPHIFPIEGEV